MFDDAYLRCLKVARLRDVQLAQTPGAEARAIRKDALERLVHSQTLIAAIEATRAEAAPSKEDLQGADVEGYPLDPAHPWFRPAG
jgi:hypothetical protein